MVQCAAVLAGPVSEGGVRAALEAAIARHEILRTTFPQAVGMRGRSQAIHETLSPDWTDEPAALGGEVGDLGWLSSVMAAEAQRGFDLERGPLVRARLLAPPQERCLLVLTAHAACADATSLLVILTELAESFAGGGELDEPVQYADYAEWRHELITGEDDEPTAGQAFWSRQSEDRPDAPKLLFASGARSGQSTPVAIAFEAAELARLRDSAQAAAVPLAVFLEASWHALIARLTGADELVIAGWCDGRGQPDLERAVGPYAQPVPIRSQLQDETSFAEILDQVARARGEATAWQDIASAAQLTAVSRDTAAGFIHLDLGDRRDPALAVAAINPCADAALLLAARSSDQLVSVELWHDPAAHSEQDAAELARAFRTLAICAAADPTQPVARLALTGSAERERLLSAAAGPAPAGDATTPVHHLFERRAQAAPDQPAVADAGDELSYGQLNVAANRLAHLLRAAGVGPGVTVGLCLERTPGLLSALLAILKAGGAYVPLNYEHPQARLSHQLAESQAAVLVTEEHLLERLPEFAGEVVCVDRDRERIAACPEDDPVHVTGADDLAYVMYTSGSTGLPKGVGVTHGNLANYATHMAQRLGGAGASEDDRGLRFGVVSAISTDLGNTCIFPALISGGCLQLISPGAAMDAEALAGELGDHALDVLKITPSHLRALLCGPAAAAVLPRRWLVLGGEALRWDLVDQIRALGTGCAIVNHYGPTETTIGCCAYDVDGSRTDSATVPIGGPLAGVRAYVLDRSLAPVPAGVPGELCIAGAGVARGYVGAAQDPASPFTADPFCTDPPARMYRTGDRARRLRDGAIEFLGRVDDQVKIRGFRIEPGEIETALGGHSAVRQAAVVPEPDDRGELRLVAYIATSAQPSVEDLQAFLSQSLPDYMVPSAFATLDSLPFTPSGKVDRRALSGLAAVKTRREAEYVAPRDECEREIAAIWAELLGTEQVGVFDDFFALGGHSLLATQAIMRIRRLHGDIPLRALLAAPTVADLAEVVRSSAAGRT